MTRLSVSVVAALLLTACGGEDEVIVLNSGTDTVFSLPAQLRDVAAVNSEDLILEVRVNEQPVQIPKTGSDPDVWSGVVNVPAGQTSQVSVSWSQLYTTNSQSYDLTLAQQQKVIAVGTEAQSVDFRIGGYNTISHDQDDDGLSNLAEINESRSPLDRVDAYMEETGTFPTGLPQPFSSECGTRLPVGVRVQYAGDAADVIEPENLSAWWCALYVEQQTDAAGNTTPIEGLQIIVNVVDDIFPITDSAIGRKYDDDSIEIFIDGNNSKGTNYDGTDDYQFVFLADGDNSVPLAKGPGTPANLTSDIQLTASGYKLTVFIPRVEVGIQHGQPFGINVEVNDDDDGGLRDSKHTWIGKNGLDRSWTQPRAFGTSQIP